MLLDELQDPEVIVEDQRESVVDVYSLVLSSSDIPHQVLLEGTVYSLYVSKNDLLKAQWQIKSYEQENRDWPPPENVLSETGLEFRVLPLFLVAALILIYCASGPWNSQSNWFTAGAGNAILMHENNEWFRALTALFLHADSVHLTGNVIVGGTVFYFLCLNAGSGLALFLSLFAAFLANVANVFSHPGGHNFVGFSTSVFAIIGILSTMHPEANKQNSIKRGIVVPLLAGLGLLAILGSSGERTDFGGHFYGLLFGFATGFILRKRESGLKSSIRFQSFFLILSLSSTLFLWMLAFHSYPSG